MPDVPEQRDEDAGRCRRRSVLKYGGTGALTAGLAGCQSPDNPVPGGNLRVDGDDSDPVDPVEDDGGGDDALPLEGETVRVGVLGPMNLPMGTSMWDAARQAADDLNETGGILGADVEVELGDTEVAPGTAQEEHRRLITQEDCDITVGIFLGSALLQTMSSIANLEHLHITTGSAAPQVGKLVSRTNGEYTSDSPEDEYERYKYHFRAGPIHLYDLAEAMLELVERHKDEYGWERAAILTEDIGELTPYAERLAEELDNIIDVRLTERPGGVANWRPLYNEIEEEDCDVALIGMALGGTTAVNQWAQQQREFEFGGIHVAAQAYEYWEGTDGNTEHVFTMNAFTPQTENTEFTQGFIQEYIDRWDSVPIYTGALTYEAFALIEQSIAITVEGEGLTEVPDADTMIPYMENHTFQAGDGPIGGTVIQEFQWTPPDAEYAHEPQWTSMEEMGVPVFQQWQRDPDIRDDYGVMHSFAPEKNKTADKTVPDWIEGA